MKNLIFSLFLIAGAAIASEEKQLPAMNSTQGDAVLIKYSIENDSGDTIYRADVTADVYTKDDGNGCAGPARAVLLTYCGGYPFGHTDIDLNALGYVGLTTQCRFQSDSAVP